MIFHSELFLFPQKKWKDLMLSFGVDIGFDFLDCFSESGIFFHLFFYLLDRIKDCGVIPVVELFADIVQA